MNTHSPKTYNPLNTFRKKGASQYGEEGVIEEVLRIVHEHTLQEAERWCVEFGAGRLNTNTRRLITEKGWCGVLIEAHPVYSRELRDFYVGNSRVFCLRSFVGFEGKICLDALLSQYPIPRMFDFLSIDIDGNDYHVWKAVSIYSPQVVMVEYNGRIPSDIAFIQPRDMNVSWGSSLTSLVALGKQKGYELVYAYVCNAIFVKKEFLQFFNLGDNSPAAIAETIFPRRIFFEMYDGSIVLHGCERGNLLSYKKKFKKHPVWLLDKNGLSPVVFTRDKRFLRIIKNFIKTSFLATTLYPFAELFYGNIWRKKREKLRANPEKEKLTKKKIGIVLHPYGEDKPAGLARTIFELTKGMLEIDSENEYIIFLKNIPHAPIDLPGKNWRVETLGGGRWWLENLRTATRADVYVFNTPVLPLFWKPPRSIVLALDFAYYYLAERTVKAQVLKWATYILHAIAVWRADFIVAISEATKKDVIGLFKIPAQKVKVVYCGFKKVCSVPEKQIDLPQRFFLFVGIIKQRKNVLNIVRAFNLFLKENPGYTLLLGGNDQGVYYNAIQNYIQNEGIQGDIFFAGHLNDNELSYVYRRAEALVFPTLVEGFGFPVLEAMDCGIPVITSNRSSLKEIGGNGAALLVTPDEPRDIARAMQAIVEKPNLRAGLVQAGFIQSGRFSWRKAGKEFLNIIVKMIEI
ncbi:MAG: glycosyltransferase family 4 protein [Parcubacteria group bacterium]|nr:glycosyltransferase family 4 protein [Parcubacteria group bacterium]